MWGSLDVHVLARSTTLMDGGRLVPPRRPHTFELLVSRSGYMYVHAVMLGHRKALCYA
jgi:hypothetical protein